MTHYVTPFFSQEITSNWNSETRNKHMFCMFTNKDINSYYFVAEFSSYWSKANRTKCNDDYRKPLSSFFGHVRLQCKKYVVIRCSYPYRFFKWPKRKMLSSSTLPWKPDFFLHFLRETRGQISHNPALVACPVSHIFQYFLNFPDYRKIRLFSRRVYYSSLELDA